MFDIAACRKDSPVLGKTIYGKPLVYLDNAATTQVPKQVLEAFSEHYEQEHANVHRGIHYLSERCNTKARGSALRGAAFFGRALLRRDHLYAGNDRRNQPGSGRHGAGNTRG